LVFINKMNLFRKNLRAAKIAVIFLFAKN